MIVDCAYYEHGVRQRSDLSLEEAAACPRHGGQYVWIELDDPSTELMAEVSRHFGLHELAVEDAAQAHQRPKVEAYDDFYFIVYRTAQYDKANRKVIFGELDLFLGVGFVIAVRHDEAGDHERARRHLEQYPHLARTGPAAAVWAILDMVVDAYQPVVDGLESDIEDAELAIFSGGEDLTEQIYELKQESNEFYRAVHPLLPPLESLERGIFTPVDPGLRRYFRDLADHVRRIDEELLGQRDQLTSALEAHLSLINLRQNEITAQQNDIVKRLTIVASIFLPLTFITGFFGQNFLWMVNAIQSSTLFFAAGIGSLVASCCLLLIWFKRSGYT
ncbi:MAG: magnesium and cobalt transport protein CorA [Actinobacteria bacterium]|nr:magnesium and cobalt transport protein CorA [Actinomycetota bacterium]